NQIVALAVLAVLDNYAGRAPVVDPLPRSRVVRVRRGIQPGLRDERRPIDPAPVEPRRGGLVLPPEADVPAEVMELWDPGQHVHGDGDEEEGDHDAEGLAGDRPTQRAGP